MVVSPPSSPFPMARRPSGGGRRRRAAPKKRRRGGARVGASGGGRALKTRMTSAGLGGFGVGFIEKNWGHLIPTLPFVGRKGAVALAMYFLEPKMQILQDVGIAAAAISGYEMGAKGTISGEDDDYYVLDGEDDDDDDMVST